MAKAVSPDKGKSLAWYRDEKVAADWQRQVLDQANQVIEEACPAVRSSIKWSQPVWETPEGPLAFFRSAAKHATLGFWRGAELTDPEGVLEGEGDRMKHLKFKAGADFDAARVRRFVLEAVALNAQKGDPTKGK